MTNTTHKRDIRHPAFPQLDDDVPLWRYTDLAKFVWTLSQSALWLSRGDLLGDKFEGSIPTRDHTEFVEKLVRGNVEKGKSEAQARHFVLDKLLPRYTAMRRTFLLSSHMNCWSAAAESEAMWRLYCGPSDGVAMVTTFVKLKASLTDRASRLAAVRYIDYNKDNLSGDDLLQPMTHKRAAFEYEKEVRIVRWLQEDMKEFTLNEAGVDPTLDPGRKMEWSPENAVVRVVVSPYSQEWYFDAVKDVLTKFAPSLADHLQWSDLRGDPIF